MTGRFPLRFAEVGALVVVLLILGLLLWGLRLVAHERALRAECASNLHQIGLAMLNAYAQDNANHLPDATAGGFIRLPGDDPTVPVDGGPNALIGFLYPEYVPDIRVFWCPTSPPSGATATTVWFAPLPPGQVTSYGYDPRHLNTHPRGVAIMADRPPSGRPRAGRNSPNHYGYGQNVLYLDGHAEWKTTTNVGYAGDEIYIDNTGEVIGDGVDNRRDSCILGYGGSIKP